MQDDQMNAQTDTRIEQKVQAFTQRRRRLIIIRGLLVCSVALIATMSLVVIADWLFFLSEPARWMLSAFAYCGVAVSAWLLCLRNVLRVPDAKRIARLMELASPELREDLISAVELSDPTSANAWDSEEFRRLLQEDVAHRVNHFNVSRALPSRLLQFWFRSAAIAVGVCLLLSITPGLHFPQRMARALLPMADIPRVAQTQIEFLAPNPPDRAAPEGEDVEILVRLSGPAMTDRVTLETWRDSNRQRTRLTPTEQPRTFRGSIRVAREDIRYRIRANDARTSKRLIVARTRPSVAGFQKTIRYPEYLAAQPKILNEASGDIATVMGSTVELVINTNQPVSLAQLEMETGGREQMIPLTPDISSSGQVLNRVRGKLTINQTGVYRVRLVSAETGFENKFRPEYVIRADQDAPPSIRIVQPTGRILAPPDRIIGLRAAARDDWRIAGFERHVRINDGAWMTAPIETFASLPQDADAADHTKARRMAFELPWDLAAAKVQPGDVVFLKLSARDQLGGVGESKPIQIHISSRGFDPQRLRALLAARQARDALRRLVDGAEELLETTDAPNNPLTSDAWRECRERAEAARAELLTATSAATIPRIANDLRLAGRCASSVLSRRPWAADSSAEEARRTARALRDETRAAAAALDGLVNAETAALVTSDLLEFSELLAMANQDAARGGTLAEERLRRAHRTIAQQLEASINLLREENSEDNSEENSEGNSEDNSEDNNSVAAAQLTTLRQAAEISDNVAKDELLRRAARLRRELSTAVEAARRRLVQNRSAAQTARQQLAEQAGPATQSSNRAAELASRFIELKASLGEQAARGEFDALQTRARETKQLKEQIHDSLVAATSTLAAQAEFEQAGPDAESQFVADFSRGRRALEQLHAAILLGGEDDAKNAADLARLAKALEVVDVVLGVDKLAASTETLRDIERGRTPESVNRLTPGSVLRRVDAVDYWHWARPHLRSAILRLEDSRVDRQALAQLQSAADSEAFGKVDVEMRSRSRSMTANGVALAIPNIEEWLDAIDSDVKAARSHLDDELYQARQVIAELAPQLSRLLAKAAEKAADLEQRLQDMLNTAKGEPLEEEGMQARLAEAERNDAIQELRDALRHDANAQDLLSDEGRERARDDDDAIAQLDQAEQNARDAVQDAANADPDELAEAIRRAQLEEARLMETLEQLAEHFQNLENGNADQTRQELRDQENALGADEQLAQRNRQLEALADLARLEPREALAALEQELAANEQMQNALDQINRQQLVRAENELAEAAQRQAELDANSRRQALAQQLQQLAERTRQFAANELAAASRAANRAEIAAEDATNQVGEDGDSPADAGDARSNDSDTADADNDHENPIDAHEELATAQQALARAASQAEAENGARPDVLSEAAEDLQEALRAARSTSQEVANQLRAPAREQANPRPQANNRQAAAAARTAQQLARQAAERAAELEQQGAQLAEQLAAEADESPAPTNSNVPQSEQEDVEQLVNNARDAVERAARNEARLRRDDAAEQLEEIADAAARAQQLLQNQLPDADRENSPAVNPFLDEQAAPELFAANDNENQPLADAVQQPAEQLSDFLDQPQSENTAQDPPQANAEPSDPGVVEPGASELGASEPGASEPGASELGASEPGASEPGASEPGASEPGASEPGASAPGASEPGASEPGASEPGASEPGASEPGASEPGASEPGASEPGASEPGASESGASEPGASEPGASEPGASEPGASEPGASEPGASESGASEPGASEPGASESGASEPGASEPSASEPGASEPGASEPGASEPGASEPGASEPGSGSEPGALPSSALAGVSPETARQLAQALNELDRQLFADSSNAAPDNAADAPPGDSGESSATAGQPASQASNQSGQPASGQATQSGPPALAASQALASAAEAQAQSIARARTTQSQSSPSQSSPSQSPRSQTSGSPIGQGYAQLSRGASIDSPGTEVGALPKLESLSKADWARLPSRTARELLEGSREKVSPAYRRAVATYFRVLAEQARRKEQQ